MEKSENTLRVRILTTNEQSQDKASKVASVFSKDSDQEPQIRDGIENNSKIIIPSHNKVVEGI